ncbi:MAG: TonB-dependent receptor [Novosphingobium sp.]|nr:TonB-dependent receptor [Novosphingobium sp.]MCP5401856.1 TonB-dependent receptor [Novosphingobium sp.]
MRLKLFLLATAGSGLALSSVPAMAQEAGAESGGFGEIIVTARKKQESILKVPVVESVLTEAALEKFQINDIQDITTKIPGLQSANAVLAIGEQMSLRGVGSNALDQGVDQSVSLNIDGLQLTHGLAFRAASFDLQQVEVLKGPQALYFGKNSTAGVISFRSADPGDELEVKAKVGYEFEKDEKRAELVYSMPISDTVGIRLAGLYTDSKGIFKNKAYAQPGFGGVAPKNKRIGGGESWMMRATLLWEPTSETTVRFKGNLVRDRYNHGGLSQIASCPDGIGKLPNADFQFFNPDEDCVYDKTFYAVDMDPAAYPGIRNNGVPFLDLDQEFGTLQIDHEFTPELLFTSVTGYYKSLANTMINGTFAGYSGPAITADNVFKRREWTQELRLDSDFASPFNFTVGAFYQDGKVSNDFKLGGNTTQPFLPFGGVINVPALLLAGKSTIDIESISAFAQGRYAFSDVVEITGGARWTHEKRGLSVTRFGAPVTLAPGSDKLSTKNWSPEVTITYTPSDTLTIFAAAKQAYKSGSFKIVIPAANGADESYGDEKAYGGEIGMKSRLLDRSLSLDVAGYYYRYEGLQTGVNSRAEGGLPVLKTINAGEAEVYGIDFESSFRPASIDGLTLNLAVAWNKTKFLELNNVPCFGGQLVTEGCNQIWAPAADQANAPGAIVDPSGATTAVGYYTSQDLKGVPFVRAPEWQINFGFDYELPVGDNMRLVLANDNQYSSSFLTILGRGDVRPETVQPDALMIDLGLTLYGEDDRWQIGVYGKNLTDKLRPGYCSSVDVYGGQLHRTPLAGGTERSVFGRNEISCSFAAGRAIQVSFGLKY